MMLGIITYGLIGIVVVIVIGISVLRRRQKKRMEEARIRGIKSALREQQQFETLRKLEGREEDFSPKDGDSHLSKRREIRR